MSFFFFSSRRRHTRSTRDWSSDVCSSDLTKQAALVAANMGRRFQWEIPGPPEIAMAPMMGMDHFEMFGSPWGDLELVSLNSDLGEYFGAKDGVLVVKAPADSTLPL